MDSQNWKTYTLLPSIRTVSFYFCFFSDYLETWLSEIRHTIAEPTFVNYRSVLKGVICPYFARKQVRLIDLSPHDIQEFYRLKMEQDGIRRLLSAASRTVLEPVIRLAVWFGLRRGEILALKWSDIDFENRLLHISSAVSKGEKLLLKQPKTRSSIRSFSLMDEMIQYFRYLWSQQQENKARFGRSYNRDYEAFVCVNERGDWMKPDYLSSNVPKLAESCGLPRIKLHELRHSNISLILQNGASMKETQLWAGHSSYSTTADIYSHILPENIRSFSLAIEKALTE